MTKRSSTDTLFGEVLRQTILQASQTDRERIAFVQKLGDVFIAVSQFEDTIGAAMLTCDKIKVRLKLGLDAAKWEALLQKQNFVQKSTLGSLVKLLEQHAIEEADMRYLRWLLAKRNFFVHRFFHGGAWPGDLNEDECTFMCRRCAYLEIIFHRASSKIWNIFIRNNMLIALMQNEEGILLGNTAIFE